MTPSPPRSSPRALHDLSTPVTIVSEPLVGSVGPLGVLSLAFVALAEPSEPDLRFLSTLAGLTAQALERAQVFEHEREALRAAEAGRERLSLLSEVTRLLSSSLEPTTVIRRTMSLVEGRLADSCSVQVPGESGLVRLDVREPGAARPSAPASPAVDDVLPFGSDAPAAVAFRMGRTQLAPVEAGEDVADPQGVTTALAVPLTANGEVIGVMTFVDGRGGSSRRTTSRWPRRWRAGPASPCPTPPGSSGSTSSPTCCSAPCSPTRCPRWRASSSTPSTGPGSAGTYAGGDWYDVFELSNDTVFFSVGDVMGKGPPPPP